MYYEYLESVCRSIHLLGVTVQAAGVIDGEQLHFLIGTFNNTERKIYTLCSEGEPILNVYVEYPFEGLFTLENNTLDIVE